MAERLAPRGAGLAAQAQAAFVDGLGLAMLVAAAAVATAAGLVFWRAPRAAVAAPERRSLRGPTEGRLTGPTT